MSSLSRKCNTCSDLDRMVKKLKKHCEENKVQALVYYEHGPVGRTAFSGYYSHEMLKSLVVNLCISHGLIVQQGLDEFAAIAEKVKEQQKAQDGDIPGTGSEGDGGDAVGGDGVRGPAQSELHLGS